jgi:hypothetical protein
MEIEYFYRWLMLRRGIRPVDDQAVSEGALASSSSTRTAQEQDCDFMSCNAPVRLIFVIVMCV